MNSIIKPDKYSVTMDGEPYRFEYGEFYLVRDIEEKIGNDWTSKNIIDNEEKELLLNIRKAAIWVAYAPISENNISDLQAALKAFDDYYLDIYKNLKLDPPGIVAIAKSNE